MDNFGRDTMMLSSNNKQCRCSWPAAVVWLAAGLICLLPAAQAHASDNSVRALIQQAGNANSDEVRLDYLKQLRKQLGLNASLNGGGWGDDCEMWRWWVPVLIGFDSPKIAAAQARFSKALMNQSHMKSGYTTRMSDVEHTAEDSADAITPMMHLDPETTANTRCISIPAQ